MRRESTRGLSRGDERLEQGVGGEAIRAMEARAGGLTDGGESGHGGDAVDRRLHAAAAVVGGGDDGDEVLRHVDAEL